MKVRGTNAAVALVAWLCLSGAAHAQLKDNIEVNAFGGGSWYSSKDFEMGFPQSITPVFGKFKMSNAWNGGLRLGVYTRGHWSQEFYFSYEPSHANVTRTTAPTGSISLATKVVNYGVNALYYLNDNESGRFRPFVSAGIGGTAYLLTSEAKSFAIDPLRGNLPDIDNSNELAFNYGVGVKSRGTKWLGFRADVRGFVGRNPSFGLARQSSDPNATVFPATGAINNAEATAGVIFYFFGRR
jgi:outer membrane protein W